MIEILKELFFSGTHYALSRVIRETVSYYPVEGTPTDEQITAHLEGELCLGSYTLLPDSTCRWLCLDVDSVDLGKARNIATAISTLLETVPHGVEFSGNKGYHIWIFFRQTVSAERLKIFGTRLREAVGAASTGDTHVEVFPKQERLTASSPLGNLVKVPLSKHPKTGNRSIFVDINNGWETGIPVNPETIFNQLVNFEEIERLAEDTDSITKMVSLLTPYWIDGERHNLALALSGYLGSLGWSREDVEQLVTSLAENAGGEERNLLECVTTTFNRLSSGNTVQGFGALNERLPVNTMRQLSDLAGQNIANPIIQILDRIRLSKGQNFLKIRSAERSVYSDLVENGKFVKTGDTVYWLDSQTHKLINCEGLAWNVLYRQRFALNYRENFASQVQEGVRLQSWQNAEIVPIHKYFYWDGTNLWLNFGGAEVYSLNGEERKLHYNGDQNFLFATNSLTHEELIGTNLLTATPGDSWEYLVNDINFAATENVRATNEQQRELLKAWILQVFFGEIMPTRPIGMFIGVRGSGKTTAARRILRFFEGFDQDVLGLAEDKPDSLRSSIEHHLILVLDNLEKSRAKWLDNYLNRLATGSQIELRKLHRTNESYTIRPDVFVLGTGIEIPSTEEALFSRILPLEMDALTRPKPEHYMQSLLRDNFVGVWAGMLNLLEATIIALRTNRTVESPMESRLADFQVFCKRLENCTAVNGPVLLEGLNSIVRKQQNLMSRNSPVVEAIEIWFADWRGRRLVTEQDKNPAIWRKGADIFSILKDISTRSRLENFRWTTAAGFGRHFHFLVESLREDYQMETKTERNSQTGREETLYRFQLFEIQTQ